ncbi:MAG: type II toxin-antitoxin system VapC family toxin [Bacillota bacterium]
MKVLLDTHTFLWWISDNPQLSDEARKLISNGENILFLSAASGWEIAIKTGLGKLTLPADITSFIMGQMHLNSITPLPVELNHALHVYTLPKLHRDPFDRILIAQAQVESLSILTADPQFAAYQVKVIW